MDEAKTYYNEMLRLQDQNDQLREALAWARGVIMHGITESDREELYSATMRKIEAALQEDGDEK